MGIMQTNNQNDSELNRRISADLRERTQSSEREDPDYADDAAYMEETKKTSKFGWVWIVLIILAIISLVCIILI